MISVDMSSEAVGRRLRKLSQLRRLAVGLAGPRRRPMARHGPFAEMNERGELLHQPDGVAETPPPYRTSEPNP